MAASTAAQAAVGRGEWVEDCSEVTLAQTNQYLARHEQISRGDAREHCEYLHDIVSAVRSAAAHPDTDLIKAAIQVRAGLPPDSIAHEDLSRLIDLYHELQGMMADGDSGVAAMLELVHHQIHGGDRASPPSSDDMTRLMACTRNCDQDARTKAIFFADPGDGPAPINGRAALLDFLDRMTGGIDIPPLPAPGVQIPLPRRFSSAWRPPDGAAFRWRPWTCRKAWNGRRYWSPMRRTTSYPDMAPMMTPS